MDSVFFSGSISIKTLPEKIINSINQLSINGDFRVLVGDAAGFDTLLQEYCNRIGFKNVTVYSISKKPRNFIEIFNLEFVPVPDEIKGERKRQTFKDRKMTLDSDISFVVWDEKSTGSYNNIIRAINNEKKIRVFSTKVQAPINDVSEENITRIYQNTNGLTTSDLLNILYKNGIKEFETAKQLNEYLLKNNCVTKNSEGKISTYKTCNENFSFDEYYRGKVSGVKYKFELAKHLINEFKLNDSKKNYKNIRG
ncbi:MULTISPECIES: hypothetical protein [Shewanella]|uniref:Uncharacterized protein n=1 Tax=Shewanella baltica (strain OS195) TaxID=399599 RepID=A9L145_SHEB9|nr:MULTISPECIES: hypothetical protein [Shewanella]ABX47944.1 hypothetical protein Sbal195_0766 [Shewanella baltica OS195]MCU8004201.1 hypothetical protein [Shewanella sp. SM96]